MAINIKRKRLDFTLPAVYVFVPLLNFKKARFEGKKVKLTTLVEYGLFELLTMTDWENKEVH